MQIAVSFLWAIYTAAIAPSTVRRANSQMNISCTAAVHIAFALSLTIQSVLPNPRFRRPIGLLLTSAPRLSKPYRYFATFVLLLTYLPRNVLEIGRLCEKLSISCQFRGILNFFNVNEQINHKLLGLRRHIEPSKSFERDYPQLPEVGQSIVFPPIWVIFG